jgi:hypothetical protein
VSYNVLHCYVRLAFDTRLWKWLAVLSGKALDSSQEDSAYGNGWQAVLPFMELLVQLCLTACATVSYNCATASYGLWKWLASSFPIYGNGFRSGTSENQRLHKKLGNSENRVTYRLR